MIYLGREVHSKVLINVYYILNTISSLYTNIVYLYKMKLNLKGLKFNVSLWYYSPTHNPIYLLIQIKKFTKRDSWSIMYFNLNDFL